MFGILMNLVYIFNRTFITTLYTGFAFVRQKGTSCSPIMSGFQSVKPMAIFPNQTPQFKSIQDHTNIVDFSPFYQYFVETLTAFTCHFLQMKKPQTVSKLMNARNGKKLLKLKILNCQQAFIVPVSQELMS